MTSSSRIPVPDTRRRRFDLDRPATRKQQATGAGLVALGVFAWLLATAWWQPMVWDEGDALDRAEQVSMYLRVFLPTKLALHPLSIDLNWPFTTVNEGHPALLGWVIALGQMVSQGWLPPLVAARFGPMLLFSTALGGVFYRLWRETTCSVGLVAVGAASPCRDCLPMPISRSTTVW